MRVARLASVAVAMLSLAAPLRAEPEQPATASGDAEAAPPDQQALRFGHQGLQEFWRGNYEAALASFLKAESSAHSPVFVLYQARCLLKLGQLLRARDLLQQVATEILPTDAPATWQRAKEEGKQELELVEANVASVVLVMGDEGTGPFEISGAGQTLRIHERRAELELAPGSHELVAVDADGTTVRRQVRLEAGERARRVAFEFPRPEPRPQAAPRKPKAPPPPTASPARDRAPNNWGAWTALGMGIAATTFGIAAGTVALIQARSIKSRCPDGHCPADERHNVDVARGWANVSSIGFVVGLTGIGTGALLWESGTPPAAPPRSALRTPTITVAVSF